jgi:hypothetical protein
MNSFEFLSLKASIYLPAARGRYLFRHRRNTPTMHHPQHNNNNNSVAPKPKIWEEQPLDGSTYVGIQ